MLRARILLAALAVAALGLALVPLAGARTQSTTVFVKAKEFSFTLSRKTVVKGTVTFSVTNAGKLAHDFKIAGVKTPLIKPGKKASLVVKFAKAGKFTYTCTVPGHAAAGMKGVLVVK
jgi:uncharacterized cupredoxin-like copper-binding protein